jgi:hypothetical protein
MARNSGPDPILYAELMTLYDSFHREVLDMKHNLKDVDLFHRCCFAGNIPDDILRLFHRLAPELCEDAQELSEHLARQDFNPGDLAGLHIHDKKTMYRAVQGKRRTAEYAAWDLDRILATSLKKQVVIRGPHGFVGWVLGRPVPKVPVYNMNTPIGVYVGDIGKSYPSSLVLDPTYYSLYTYIRKTGFKTRDAKTQALQMTRANREIAGSSGKVGFIAETTGTPRTKYRKYGFKQKRMHDAILRDTVGHSALNRELTDAQTVTRARRTVALTAERALDEGKIAAHVAIPGRHNSVLTSVNDIKNCDPITLNDQECVNLLSTTHPFLDAELLARTRLTSPVLLRLLKIVQRKYGETYLQYLIANSTGMGLQGLAGLTTYALSSAVNATVIATVLDQGWACQGVKHFSKTLKVLHVITRRTNELPAALRGMVTPQWAPYPGVLATTLEGETRDHWMYVYLLCGRAQDELLGFDKFVEKRSELPHPYLAPVVGDNPIDRARFWEDNMDAALDELAVPVHQNLAKRRGATEHDDFSPADMHAHFISMAPRGSVGAGKEDFKRYGIPLHSLHKRLWFDALDTKALTEVLSRTPRVLTNAQVKTELGLRLRQIIPGEIHQWLIESMAVWDAEDAIFESSPVFSLGSSGWQRLNDHFRRIFRLRRGLVTVAVDFDDFNFLHTLKDMGKFWTRCIGNAARPLVDSGTWEGTNYAGHIVRCSEWLKESLTQLFVREVGSDGLYRIVHQGLWSGWRTTTLINNCMHFCYDFTIKRSLTLILGRDPFTDMRINGDDGDMASDSMCAGLLLLRHYTLTKLEAQASKQLFSYDSAEFLRIWYTRHGTQGSLARSCGSFIGGDLQDPVIDKLPDYAKGTSSAVDILIRRGFDRIIAEEIRDIVCLYYAQISFTTPDGTTLTAKLNDVQKLYIPYDQGGYGLARHGHEPHNRASTSRTWDSSTPDWELDRSVPHHGTQAMMDSIQKRFHARGVRLGSTARLHREILNLSNQGVDTQLNHVNHNIWRKGLYLHLEWLNKINYSLDPAANHTAIITETQERQTRLLLDQVMAAEPESLQDWSTPHIQEAYQKITSAVLGLAGISPGIIDDLYDLNTGTRLTLADLVERFTLDWGTEMMEFNALPQELYRAVLNGQVELRRLPGNAMPDDFLPIVEYILSNVLVTSPAPSADSAQNMQYYIALSRDICLVISDHWLVNYDSSYRM